MMIEMMSIVIMMMRIMTYCDDGDDDCYEDQDEDYNDDEDIDDDLKVS